MTILSDKEIKDLCLPPTAIITRGDVSGFSHLTLEEVDALNANQFGHSDIEYLKTIYGESHNILDRLFLHHRPITDEELKSFKPMISPFLPEQQKHYYRNPTAQELALWDELKRDSSADMLLPESWVIDENNDLMIEYRGVSRGLSSFGYDVTLSRQFKLFSNINSVCIDPLDFSEKSYVDVETDVCIVPPNSYVLGLTEEVFCIPRDMIVLVANKSTYARCGANVAITIIEPEQGRDEPSKIVLEIANSTPLPIKLYAGMGIAQFLFLRGNVPCEVSYADRGGKYVSQQSIVTPKV